MLLLQYVFIQSYNIQLLQSLNISLAATFDTILDFSARNNASHMILVISWTLVYDKHFGIYHFFGTFMVTSTLNEPWKSP